MNLGIALAAQRQFPEGIAHLRHALSREPNSPDILLNLAAALKDQGSIGDATSVYRRATEVAPSPEVFFRLACCLRDAGHLDEAIDAYQQAARLQPDFFRAHDDLGNCLYRKGRFSEAVAEYQRAIALRPDNSQTYNNLSISLHELGRHDESVAAVRRAIELRPNPEAYYNLGRVLLAQRKFLQSAEACEQALRLRPGYVEARNNLAIALEACGQADRAITEYRAVLEAKPDYLDAKMNYGVVPSRTAAALDEMGDRGLSGNIAGGSAGVRRRRGCNLDVSPCFQGDLPTAGASMNRDGRSSEYSAFANSLCRNGMASRCRVGGSCCTPSRVLEMQSSSSATFRWSARPAGT